MNVSKSALRRQMRNKRRSLSQQQQTQASIRLKTTLFSNLRYRKSQRIALYLANDGEVSTQKIIDHCWQQNVDVYLPVLNPLKKGHLLFVHYQPDSIMRTNRYGIKEPDPKYNQHISARYLNLVLMPLVAFDDQGNRLGMGGGFYDRSFEFCRPDKQNSGLKPELVGLAHQCQRAEQLPTEAWDIPLDKIIAV